jgi:hypothetical protein
MASLHPAPDRRPSRFRHHPADGSATVLYCGCLWTLLCIGDDDTAYLEVFGRNASAIGDPAFDESPGIGIWVSGAGGDLLGACSDAGVGYAVWSALAPMFGVYEE